MYSDFFNDYNTLKDNVGIVLGDRSYHWILNDGVSPETIFQMKRYLLNDLFGNVNV
jgi:hypothetical protein